MSGSNRQNSPALGAKPAKGTFEALESLAPHVPETINGHPVAWNPGTLIETADGGFVRYGDYLMNGDAAEKMYYRDAQTTLFTDQEAEVSDVAPRSSLRAYDAAVVSMRLKKAVKPASCDRQFHLYSPLCLKKW